MADKPCESCFHYDPIIRATRVGRHGRCAIKSTYPAQQEAGQIFPAGVKRAAPGEPAKPVIVVGKDTVTECGLYRAKTQKGGAR